MISLDGHVHHIILGADHVSHPETGLYLIPFGIILNMDDN